MSYSPYYPNGWQTGESGGTPITPAALNHIDDGISANEAAIEARAEDIADINTLLGNTSMGTTATTVTGAIKEHSNKIGNTAMGTTATTLTGAIKEHETDITSLNSKINGLTLTRTSVVASSSRTITTSADSSYAIFTTGASSNFEHTLTTVLQGASTNNPIACTMFSGNNVVITASAAHTLTIQNNASSHTVYVAILTLRGSAPTVA